MAAGRLRAQERCESALECAVGWVSWAGGAGEVGWEGAGRCGVARVPSGFQSRLRTLAEKAMVAMALHGGVQHGGGVEAGHGRMDMWALQPKASASPGARRASPARPTISKASKRSHLSISVRFSPMHTRVPRACRTDTHPCSANGALG